MQKLQESFPLSYFTAWRRGPGNREPIKVRPLESVGSIRVGLRHTGAIGVAVIKQMLCHFHCGSYNLINNNPLI